MLWRWGCGRSEPLLCQQLSALDAFRGLGPIDRGGFKQRRVDYQQVLVRFGDFRGRS
jgi:hypothetical protein